MKRNATEGPILPVRREYFSLFPAVYLLKHLKDVLSVSNHSPVQHQKSIIRASFLGKRGEPFKQNGSPLFFVLRGNF